MKYTKRNSIVLENVNEPLILEDCNNIKVINPQITGGEHNIHALNCSRVEVIGGKLVDPVGNTGNPDDSEGHGILFDKCKYSIVRKTLITGKRKDRGDAINIYDSTNSGAEGCIIRGPLGKYAAAFIIDNGEQRSGYNYATSLRLETDTPSRIVITDGVQNRINNVVCDAVEITGEYNGGIISGLVLSEVVARELYVGKHVISPTFVDCKFQVANYKWNNAAIAVPVTHNPNVGLPTPTQTIIARAKEGDKVELRVKADANRYIVPTVLAIAGITLVIMLED